MHRVRYIIFMLAILLLTAGVLQAQDDANTLHIVSGNDITTLDPAIGYDQISWVAEPLVYRGLIAYDADFKTVGALADKIDVSEDGTVYTFTIRDGAKFSNGRAVTAQDVKYTFERLFDPATKSPGTFVYAMIQGAQEEMDGKTKELSGVEVIDDKTVRFTLTHPEYTFLTRLALNFGGIVAKEGVDAAGEDFAREPLGAGPYTLESWDAGQQAVFVRNPNYYEPGKPIIDKIVIDIGVEAATGYLRVESGEADLSIDDIQGADYTHVASDPTLAEQLIKSRAFAQVSYITLDLTKPPFNDIRVRQAMNLAIDRDHLVQVMAGLAAPANGIIPPTVQGHNADIPVTAYDPDQAKALLTAAGFLDGFSTQLQTYNLPGPVRVSQAVVQDLAQVGIKVDLQIMEFSAWLDVFFSHPTDSPMMFDTWGMDYADPTDAYEPLLACGSASNPGSYCNADLDKQEQAAALIPPGDDRWKAFADLEANIVKDQALMFLVYPQQYFFRSARLQNLNSHPAYVLDFENASLK
ncbi:MAG: ABC transporter substrate-binding protein [Chloroflexota bacterium]